MKVYFDNSATTKPSNRVIQKISSTLEEVWGNPSSLHKMGFEAEKLLELSREDIGNSLKVKPEEIFFTPSGTISNNIGILGVARALKKRGNHIITTSTEHPSVINTMKSLEEEGFEVTYLNPSLFDDNINEIVLKNLKANTILVSIMMVNHETGQYFDVFELSKEIKKINNMTVFYTDGVQAFMKYNINLKNTQIDLFSFSGHKIHGPKGIAGLYIKENTRILPIIFGGNQEGGYLSGTQNTSFAAGLACAVLEQKDNINDNFKEIQLLKNYAVEGILKIQGSFVNLPKTSSPYILSGGIKGIRSEILLHFLEDKNIFVSSGSACSLGATSQVLKNYGLNKDFYDSTIRISFSKDTTKEEINYFLKYLKKASEEIRR